VAALGASLEQHVEIGGKAASTLSEEESEGQIGYV